MHLELEKEERILVTKNLLKTYSFETITLDPYAKIVERKIGQAQYYEEDLGNGIKLEMVRIPAGIFMMGTSESEISGVVADVLKHDPRQEDAYKYVAWETPQHKVTVGEFYIGKYQITQKQWKRVTGSNPSYFKGSKLPVEQVSWYEAVEFCEKLTAKTGKQYRLPSEAEWEYAARGGTTTPFGLGETITTSLVNCYGSYPYANAPKGEDRVKTIEVGSLGIANGYGLYDMSGNVWEWCWDWYNKDFYKQEKGDNPKGPEMGERRTVRGGSWDSQPNYIRPANRISTFPSKTHEFYGFRVARTIVK